VNFDTLLAELERLGIQPMLCDGGVALAGRRARLTPELIEEARAHKAALLAHAERHHAVIDSAVELLQRLKGCTVPAGQMPQVRQMARDIRGLRTPAEILSALQDFEQQLVALGGEYDCHLAEAISAVERTFAGAKLMEYPR
jgi:hypothetical protein